MQNFIKKYLFLNLFLSEATIKKISKNNNKINNKNIKKNNKNLKKTSEEEDNKNIPIEIKKNNVEIKFKDMELQKEFDTENKFYLELWTKYFNIFKKNDVKTFNKKRQSIQLLKSIYENYPKKIQNMVFIDIINFLDFINLKKKNILIDWNKNIFKETEIKNEENLLEITIHMLTNIFTLSELLINKKITYEEFTSFATLVRNEYTEKKEKITEINRSIEFRNLILSPINKEERIIKLKNNPIYNNYIDIFMENNLFTEEEKAYIKTNIWILIEFLDDIYENYYEYLCNQNENFPTEVEILKKIINLREGNIFLKNNSYEEIDFIIRQRVFKNNVKKINDKYSLVMFINENSYVKSDINNIQDYYKLEIFYNCLLLLVLNINSGNQIKLQKYISKINEIYGNLNQQIYSKYETHNI